MKKNRINPMPEYFDRYINKTDDVTLTEALKISERELEMIPIDTYKKLGNRVYADGKWTIKDILQHLIDTERIFSYRALAFARNEPNKMLSYDEDAYAKNTNANDRTIEDLIHEYKIVRKSFIELFKSFNEEMLLKTGKGFKGEYSVLAIGFMMPGHQRWHMDVIKEKYLPLIEAN